MAIFQVAEELILGTRMKRISERFLSDVSVIYRESGIDFEPSWFGVFFLLDRYKTLTVSEIASNLDITQSGASQIISILEKKHLVELHLDNSDKRKKSIIFTQDGFELLKKLKPIWKLMRSNMKAMMNEGESSKYLLDALSELEESFKNRSLAERVLDTLKGSVYTVSAFEIKHYNSLKKLIFHWAFNFYAPSFINSLRPTLKRNKSSITIALKDREIVAAVVGIEDKNTLNIILCDREDVDNRILINLFENYIKENRKPIQQIELDADKITIRHILDANNFSLKKEICFEDSQKTLAVYERGCEN